MLRCCGGSRLALRAAAAASRAHLAAPPAQDPLPPLTPFLPGCDDKDTYHYGDLPF